MVASLRELGDSTRTAVDAAAALKCKVESVTSSMLFVADGEAHR